MARRKTGSLLGAIYMLVGAILLAAALFAPWYSFDSYSEQRAGTPSQGYSEVVGPSTLNFYLIGLLGDGSVQTSCPSGNVSNFCPTSSSYSDARLNSTGWVIALTLGLAVAGFAAAAFSGILGMVLRGKARRRFPEVTLAFIALALGIGATVTFTVLLPGAFAHDISPSQRGWETSGPWLSFSGSASVVPPLPCPAMACETIPTSWGPSIGWCFSIAAIAVLLVGTVMMIRFRHDVARAVSPTASERSAPQPIPETPAT